MYTTSASGPAAPIFYKRSKKTGQLYPIKNKFRRSAEHTLDAVNKWRDTQQRQQQTIYEPLYSQPPVQHYQQQYPRHRIKPPPPPPSPRVSRRYPSRQGLSKSRFVGKEEGSEDDEEYHIKGRQYDDDDGGKQEAYEEEEEEEVDVEEDNEQQPGDEQEEEEEQQEAEEMTQKSRHSNKAATRGGVEKNRPKKGGTAASSSSTNSSSSRIHLDGFSPTVNDASAAGRMVISARFIVISYPSEIRHKSDE